MDFPLFAGMTGGVWMPMGIFGAVSCGNCVTFTIRPAKLI